MSRRPRPQRQPGDVAPLPDACLPLLAAMGVIMVLIASVDNSTGEFMLTLLLVAMSVAFGVLWERYE